MLYIKNIHELRKEAIDHKMAPSATAWFRLETKLEKARSKRKINFYKYFSYAAAMVTIISVISYFQSETKIKNQVAITSHFYPYQISELTDNENNGIYDVSRLQELRVAYRKLGIKRNL